MTDPHFTSTERRRADCVVLLLCPCLAPLSHETADLPTQSPTPNTFNFQLFKDLPSEIAVFGFQFCNLASRARAIFCGPPTQKLNCCLGWPHPYSWHFLGAVLGHLGAFLAPSWAILGAVFGQFSSCSASWGLVPPTSARGLVPPTAARCPFPFA